MAVRARLAPSPAKAHQGGSWHKQEWKTFSVNLLKSGDRRMEAEGYLSAGYGTRISIENSNSKWNRLGDIATVWQPNRLKGIQVSSDYGRAFLSATQVFDVKPMPRKWLALERTPGLEQRFLSNGQIVVTCSGAVGRTTLAHNPHRDVLISHDLLRVDPSSSDSQGWIYAFLRSPQARGMMSSAQYGHIIKHLEVSHLEALPVPHIKDIVAKDFNDKYSKLLKLRNESFDASVKAEKMFEEAIGGKANAEDIGEKGFFIGSANKIFSGKRRFDAFNHNPGASSIWKHLEENGKGFTKIKDAGFKVWVPKRYKRIPAEDGVEYYDSADLMTLAPESVKTYADSDFGDSFRGRVDRDWLLMPCSGQVYGIIGSVVMPGEFLNGKVFSNHVLRIAPTDQASIPKGYLLTALSHQTLGRPLLKSLAHGSSVPEIDPLDVENLPVVRVGEKLEQEIAELAELAVKKRNEADFLEKEISELADKVISDFIG